MNIYDVTITWRPEDIMDITNLTREEAIDWLHDNRSHIIDRSVELGWDVIDTLLDMDGIARTYDALEPS